MKTSMLIAVLSACICTGITAQAQETHFGLKAGLNIADLHVSNNNNFSSRASFNIGALAHIHVTQHFAIQPEVLYSGQGADLKNSGNPTVTYKLNYINVPVLAQYMTGSGFRLETGPQLGFLASAKTKSGNVTVDVDDSFKALDFAWAFGVGYQFPRSGFGVDARYNLGISDISEANNSDVQNRVFQIGAFYQFMRASRK